MPHHFHLRAPFSPDQNQVFLLTLSHGNITYLKCHCTGQLEKWVFLRPLLGIAFALISNDLYRFDRMCAMHRLGNILITRLRAKLSQLPHP